MRSGSIGRFCIEMRIERSKLVTVEIFAFAVGFDHHQITQLHAFIGREPAAAGRAKTATADGYVILARDGCL